MITLVLLFKIKISPKTYGSHCGFITCTELFNTAYSRVPDTYATVSDIYVAVSDTYILIQNQVAVLHLKEITA